MSEIRVRFAPSPTGYLHVGGLRTALFNFLFAGREGGKFILRIEDTDKSREVAGAEENIISTLRDFKLDFDEGPIRQSERMEIYKKYADELISKGAAYKCFCTPERIQELKAAAAVAKVPFKYDKHCLHNPLPNSPHKGEGTYVLRQNVPEEGSTEFEDVVHGKIHIENRTIDDGVLVKSDGYPVYNFANVIDDHEMGITHVIRGEEFIPSTPKHILLYEAFGWTPPQFVHLPLLLDKHRKKLSKRFGDVAVKEYVQKGYLKEAIVNFVAFLGWNPKTTQEVFSLEELIAGFSLEKVNKSGAVFDVEKLDFINRQWQKRLNLGVLDPMYQRSKGLLEEKFAQAVADMLPVVWPLILERVKGPSELEEKLPEFDFFFENPKYEKSLLIWKDAAADSIKENLKKIKSVFEAGKWDEPEIKKFLVEQGIGTGEALWPLRVALSGLKNSPSPFDIVKVFLQIPGGKDEIMKRIDFAIASL